MEQVLNQNVIDAVDLKHKKHIRILIITGFVFLVYLIGSILHFDLPNLAKKWNKDRASMFMLDIYAHKDHILSLIHI